VREDIYVPYGQWNFPRMDLVVRVACGGGAKALPIAAAEAGGAKAPPPQLWESQQCADPLSIVPDMRAAVLATDPDLPLASVTTLARAVEEATAGPRFTAVLLGVLALVAVIVAAIGTFSVLSWSVERRTREIGVRVALGARRTDVLSLVVGQAARLTMVGVAGGLGVAMAAGRGLAGLLHAISPYDPMTLAGSMALLVAVGLGGGLLASRRALAVEPAIALKEE
jgi:putative ABC transport system permease protein